MIKQRHASKIWYLVPTRLCKIDAQQVERITITKDFTIQTEDAVKTEIWSYECVKGNLCYEYIDELSEAAR